MGVDWRTVSWSASLSAKFHIVILSPDIADSVYISKEALLSRARKTAFIPVLAEEFASDENAKSQIRQALSSNRNLVDLNAYQWLIPTQGYSQLVTDLTTTIQNNLAAGH